MPPADERGLLGLRLRERALVREVALCCDGTAWVFARSVFPRASLAAARWRIGHLGNRPLGNVLFTTPGMRRVSARVMPAHTDSSLYRSAAACLPAAPVNAWQRDSLFASRGPSLLVSELFLEPLSRATRDT